MKVSEIDCDGAYGIFEGMNCQVFRAGAAALLGERRGRVDTLLHRGNTAIVDFGQPVGLIALPTAELLFIHDATWFKLKRQHEKRMTESRDKK